MASSACRGSTCSGAGLATTICQFSACASPRVWVRYALPAISGSTRVLGCLAAGLAAVPPVVRSIGTPISGHLPAGIRRVRRRRSADGPDSAPPRSPAHQIALQVASHPVHGAVRDSMAATVRVGHANGRGDSAGTGAVRLRRNLAGIALMFAMTLLVIATLETPAFLFLGTITTENSQTAALAATLMVVGAEFLHLLTACSRSRPFGALRGLNPTTRGSRCCSRLSASGRPASLFAGLSASSSRRRVGVWVCLSLSASSHGVLMLVLRFSALHRRGYMPDVPEPRTQSLMTQVRFANVVAQQCPSASRTDWLRTSI